MKEQYKIQNSQVAITTQMRKKAKKTSNETDQVSGIKLITVAK